MQPIAGPDASRARCVFPKAFDRKLEAGATQPGGGGEVARARVAGQPEPERLLQRMRVRWRQAAGAVVSVVAPADCRACGGPLLDMQQFAVCHACIALLRPEFSALCHRCGERLPFDDLSGSGFSRQAHALCEACATEAPPFVRAVAFGSYDGMLRTLIRLHKFEGLEELAGLLGPRLLPALETIAEASAGAPLHVVPVPLFRGRRLYNQSAQIAAAAVRAMRRRNSAASLQMGGDALRRTRPTESQSNLTPAQRRSNVRRAFAVNGEVSGWTVVLVDDVYTTGATAKECSRTLLDAGAAAVYVVTLARTQPDRMGKWDQPAPVGNRPEVAGFEQQAGRTGKGGSGR